MNLTLKIWRQANGGGKEKMVNYSISDVSPDMSFLEMMDMHNEQLINKGEKIPLLLIMIVEREYVECVPCLLMVKPMDRTDL